MYFSFLSRIGRFNRLEVDVKNAINCVSQQPRLEECEAHFSELVP